MKKNSLIVAIAGAILFSISLIVFWYQGKKQQDIVIADHIVQLAATFNKIHATCKIIDFEHQQNYIDFLNVISFVGSEVGPMNLTYPEKWEGPYLNDNPTIQEKYYQVVRTKKGHFIVPGPDVRLSNGTIIGKDIIFDEDADVQDMIQRGILSFEGRPLAVQIMNGIVPSVPAGETEQDRAIRERLKNL